MGNSTSSNSCPADGCGPFGSCLKCTETDPCVGHRCKCDYNYIGDDCSIQIEYCEGAVHPTDDSVSSCWNGGTCVEEVVIYENEDAQAATGARWRCDCSTTGFQGDAYTSVGHQCEYQSETSCVMGQEFSSKAFCVNNGVCMRMVQPGEAHPGCYACPEFEGRHCQYAKGTAPIDELKFAQLQRDKTESSSSSSGPSSVAVFFIVVILIGVVAVVGYVAGMHFVKRRSSNQVTSELAKNVDDDENNTQQELELNVVSVDDGEDYDHPPTGGGSTMDEEIVVSNIPASHDTSPSPDDNHMMEDVDIGDTSGNGGYAETKALPASPPRQPNIAEVEMC